jgi:hypothetical protein
VKRIIPVVVILAMLAGFLQLGSFSTGVKASPGVEAICVPWQSSDPSIPHYTYTGAQTTLKGIARGDAAEFMWNFGDGSATSWAAISSPYNLAVKHTYTGVVGMLFLATLSVRDGSGNVDQDTYPVKIFESSDLCDPSQEDVRISMAVDEGLWYLHTTMIRATYGPGSPGYEQPYGYWVDSYYGYHVAATGTSVDAFQLHGHGVNGDFNNDPYVETVQRAFNYLLCYTYAYAIGLQPAGNPDTNGNGIGLVINYTSNLYDGRQTYIGGICMTALASSGAPGRVAPVGGDYVYGRTFGDIVQDMVDFFAWGQVDSGSGRGGWRYYANYGGSDMSTTQWPPLAMLAAEQNMGANVPQFVRDELIYFLDYTQNTDSSEANGAFGYDGPWSMLNIIKAAAGIICHEFVGTPLTDSRVERAIGYIYRHWNDTGSSWDDQQLLGNSYGMYGVMKGFRIPEPDIARATEYDYVAGGQTANTFDWYYTPCNQTQQGLASYTVSTQQADGSWDDTVGANPVGDAFCTGWRILVLLKGVTIAPPVAVICDSDEQEYNLNQDIHVDGTCSYHPITTRSIVLYEWDFDYDGTFESDATGPTATLVGGYAVEGYYAVALRVTDDNPEEPQTDTVECLVYVHPPPHCPHAFAGGPYIGWINQPVSFDASKSWDPDNEIVSYEWDLDNDGLFGAEDSDCFGQPSDAIGINPQWTWDSTYFGVIGLRVTDAAGPYESCFDVDYDTVEIGNHHPIADPGGPYLAKHDTCITLDGAKSSDPDPGDSITYAWDLDGDGLFDDCFQPTCQFCVGSVIGTVHDIGLRVKDSFGLEDTAYTTITVVDNVAPVAFDDGYGTNENTALNVSAPGVLGNDTDADGDAITAILVSSASHGALTLNGDGSFTYTPTANYAGSDSFTYKANDGELDSNVATVTITVIEVLRVSATIDFDPNTLNLGSQGKVVTVYIELPRGYSVRGIEVSSIRLNGTVPALAKPTAIGDYDKDGIPDLMVKFDRAAVEKILAPGDQVEITIEGKVAGVDFQGSDTIRVIAKGRFATAGVGDIPYLGYILAGLLGCFVIAAGMVTFYMWGRPLPTRD